MKITKMHGLGNDFILTVHDPATDYPEAARKLCPRRVGVGADGIITVGPSDKADVRMHIFNADGSEAEMCGNGIRCLARFVYDQGMVMDPKMTVETNAGIMEPELVLDGGEVIAARVNMGKPDFSPEAIPVQADDPMEYTLNIADAVLPLSSVLMGVPHTILFTGPVTEETISALGPAIETAEIFPKRTNVNFVEVAGPDVLRVRTWERGCGRTMACGTGSCASALVAAKKGITGPSVRVELEAGSLQIEIETDGTVFMTGPAAYVFIGNTL